MQPHAIPCLCMAAITFYVGIYHLFHFIKRPQAILHLPFALICFSVGMYDIFCVGLYNAQSVSQGAFWQNLQLRSIFFISVFVVIFVARYTNQKKNKAIWFYYALFSLFFLVSLVVDDKYTLNSLVPNIKHIDMQPFLSIIYYEGEVGPIATLGIISSVAVYSYLLFLLARHYRQSKDYNALIIMSGQFAFFTGVVNDSCIGLGLYSFIYLCEYAFMVIILGMAYVLLNEFVDLHSKVEQYSFSLEKMVGERTEKIRKLNDELKHQAEMDALTGIYNRRFFNEYFELEVKRAKNEIDHPQIAANRPNGMNFGLAILDIDNFKRINDSYGHLMGDQVLVQTVDVIKENIFTRDVFCRYGGEEFVLLFTRTSKKGIIQAVEKICKAVAEHPYIVDPELPQLNVTVSIGAVAFDEVSNIDNKEILKLADDRLYTAKQTGRNKAVFD